MNDLWPQIKIKKRTKAGKELDEKYRRHEIGYTHYHKIKNKQVYWEWSN